MPKADFEAGRRVAKSGFWYRDDDGIKIHTGFAGRPGLAPSIGHVEIDDRSAGKGLGALSTYRALQNMWDDGYRVVRITGRTPWGRRLFDEKLVERGVLRPLGRSERDLDFFEIVREPYAAYVEHLERHGRL